MMDESEGERPLEDLDDDASAGFWIRAGAYSIDMVVILAAQALFFLAAASLLVVAGRPAAAAAALTSVLSIPYFVLMPVLFQGQTLGKMAARIAVVRSDGRPLTVLRCLGRWLGYGASGLLLGFGFIMAAFTPRKRALHDYLACTEVVYVDEIGWGRRTIVVAAGVLIPLGMLCWLAFAAFSGPAEQPSAAKPDAALEDLARLRGALAAYQKDHEAAYPQGIFALTPDYLDDIPALQVADHPETGDTQIYDVSICSDTAVDGKRLSDTGRWGYVGEPQASCQGRIFIDCTHTDAKGSSWSSY